MLAKKFQLIKDKLAAKDYAEAKSLLAELEQQEMTGASKKLHIALTSLVSEFEEALASLSPVEISSNKLSVIDELPILPGISIVTACMNRNSNLKKAMPSWLDLPVDEIIIVDWSSAEPVKETLKDIKDKRVKVIRVEKENKWVLTYAFNIGLRFARYSNVIKLDADIQVSRDFLSKNRPNLKTLVRGNWKAAVDEDKHDQKFVNGSFVAPKEALKIVGYYNEFIRSYGWDDSDIYNRLVTQSGLISKYIASSTILHLEQKQEERLAHQALAKHEFLDRFPATEFYNMRNKFITALYDEWKAEMLTDYSVYKVSDNYYLASNRSEELEIPNQVLIDADSYAVSKLLSWVDHEFFKVAGFNKEYTRMLRDDYEAGIPYVNTKQAIIQKYNGELAKSNATLLLKEKTDKERELISKFVTERSSLIHGATEHTVVPGNKEELSFSNFVKDESTVFLTSVFDEKNEQRVSDYIYCIEENSRHFDTIVLVYEKFDGSFLDSLRQRISKKKFDKLVILTCSGRPTFEFLFSLADAFFPTCYIHVANSDIAADETVKQIPSFLNEDKFFVLSRHEVDPRSGEDKGLILSNLGVANTFSADMWIYKAPRKHLFKADFGIGTFHCDSFLNYYISESDYQLYNPCLSVNIYHIHDPVFNSSEAKAELQKVEIDKKLIAETKLNNGISPICGSRWSDLESSRMPPINKGKVYWKDAVLVVPVTQTNLFTSVVLINHCLHYMRGEGFYFSIWLQITAAERSSNFIGLVNRTVAAFETEKVNVTIEDVNREPLVPMRSSGNICFRELTKKVHANSALDDLNSVFYSDDVRTGTVVLDTNIDDLECYKMLKNCDKAFLESTRSILTKIGEVTFTPHLEDLKTYIASEKTYSESLHSYVPEMPEVTFITSIFKGEKFMRGFLSNIAAAAVEGSGHVILLDAQSPQNEEGIFKAFIAEYPELTQFFTYVKLEEDPGLYNCWKLGIETSKSRYVSNANLDDRRSPFQTTALIDELKKDRRYRGAASAMRANKEENANYYSVCDDQYWFNEGYSETIEFDSLYFKNDEGLILSHNIMHCMPIWDKELHDKYGFFNEERYGTSADWAFWLKCTKQGELFRLVPGVFSQYFINEQSHNRANDLAGVKENQIVLDYFGIKQAKFIQQ